MQLEPTVVKEDTFKEKPMFKIVKVDEAGEEVEEYSTIVTFGIKKASYLLNHVDDLKKFVEEHGSED